MNMVGHQDPCSYLVQCELLFSVAEGIDDTLSYAFIEKPSWTGCGGVQLPIHGHEGLSGGLCIGAMLS